MNTGIGTQLGNVVISEDNLIELNENLIRSHCVGTGNPISAARTRSLMAVRLNYFADGYSGVSRKTVESLLGALNKNCLPVVPERGSVGAHDLAQLSHMTLGLLGEGQMWTGDNFSDKCDARKVLDENQQEKLKLQPKDAISMISGNAFAAALGAEAAHKANMIVNVADIVAAMTIEGLVGTTDAFDPDIHNARPHKGQIIVARKIRSLLNNRHQKSAIGQSWAVTRVQDPYTLRCIPQVHGASHDVVEFATELIENELDSSQDNPMVLIDQNTTTTCGNFHGAYISKALDYLAIGVHEIGNMGERRIERLLNPACSELPAFLTPTGGINSGFMIGQVTASALVSENKTLCHPASVDTIATCAGYEDHVSMSGWAARKALTVVENVERVLAIELLCACQAVDLRRPLTSTPILEKVHACVRSSAQFMTTDRVLSTDIEAVALKISDGTIWNIVKDHIEAHID